VKRALTRYAPAGWLVALFLLALMAPALSLPDPYQPVAEPLSPPGDSHPLGVDALGRDVLARMVFGSRITPGISLIAVMITVGVGGLAGLIAAMAGGWLDRVIVWMANAALAIPGLLPAMLLAAALRPSLSTVILAIGFGGAPGFVRLARTLFRQVKGRRYVDAAVAIGAGPSWIARRHLLPNAFGQLLSLATTYYAWSFMGVTTLTFLGLAGDPSIPEWGAMLDASREHLINAPWLALWPGLCISATILSVHNLGAWISESQQI
jgi:peptide/nickel transport system permease protein